ncbi:MAG: aminomethyl transferase family protein [Chloroflexi bacterium]|nr:aminomethyl transferase family protein [Chloroflexota bacterium]
MARSPQTVAIDLAQAFATYEKRGVAVFSPQFGSTFRHVGPDALDLLHRLTTNSIIDIPDGSARRTILTNEKGRIVDVFWVMKRSDEELLLVTDSTDPSSMRDWIDRFTIIEDAELIDASDFLARWYVVGPNASDALGEAFPELDFADCGIGELRGMDVVDGGVVLFLMTDTAGLESWLVIGGTPGIPEINSRFEKAGMEPVSNKLFDHIRISNKVPIAGFDLTEDVNPLEAGLLDLIHFEKGCYIGQEVIARLDTYDKVQRSLVGFSQTELTNDVQRIEIGDDILSDNGARRIGWVTSVAQRPRTNELIGLAYLRKTHTQPGSVVITSEGTNLQISP